MELIALLHFGVTAIYSAVLLLVQVLVYPQFQAVPSSAFARYHRGHCRRMGWVVGPLFGMEGMTALVLAWQLWTMQPLLQGASIGLFLVGHGITFTVFIPLHHRLGSRGADPALLRRAVKLNALRVLAASARVMVAGAISLGVTAGRTGTGF
ncbi:MAG: hypothetical protein R6V45_02100 [Oceanipulchritudo sp.]